MHINTHPQPPPTFCKRFKTLNLALRVVHKSLYRLFRGKKKKQCWPKAELKVSCVVRDIYEGRGSEVRANQLKFLRNPGLKPQSWKLYEAQRPSSRASSNGLQWLKRRKKKQKIKPLVYSEFMACAVRTLGVIKDTLTFVDKYLFLHISSSDFFF